MMFKRNTQWNELKHLSIQCNSTHIPTRPGKNKFKDGMSGCKEKFHHDWLDIQRYGGSLK